jgi:predicted MFS family arabinose efflux permease
VCAVVPTALVYVADKVPFSRRQSVIADLLAAVAVGTAAGTLAAGVFAHFWTWRLAFALPAVVAAVLTLALRGFPESRTADKGASPAVQLRRALARPWARFLVVFAIPEGAMILGFLVYLAPALESTGQNSAVAGLVVAVYGAAVLTGTQVVKRVASRLPGWVPILIGGVMVIAGYLVATLGQQVPEILFAGVMLGGCYAFLHTGLQSWATDVAPEARGTSTALFVTGAFTGAAVGSAAGAGFAQAHDYHGLFAAATALSVPVVLIAVVARARYAGSVLPEGSAAAAS